MGTMTPAQRRALYESARFARETTYNGPLGPEYTPAVIDFLQMHYNLYSALSMTNHRKLLSFYNMSSKKLFLFCVSSGTKCIRILLRYYYHSIHLIYSLLPVRYTTINIFDSL